MSVRISKSKLIAFRQCPKRLWLEVHRPDLKDDDDSAKARFASGHRIGELAQTQYPDGHLIAPDNNLSRALAETKSLLASSPRKVLFEATFQAEGLLVRADLLIPAKSGWHMVEVKSSASVKPYHIEDAAIQSWVARKSGLTLSNMSLQVVDSKWTYPGGNHYSGLLKVASLDNEIAPLQKEVPKWLKAAQKIIAANEPSIKMGKQCAEPFSCGFQTYCESKTAPTRFPINWLPNLHHSKSAKYEAAGFLDLREIPVEDLSDTQRRVLQSTIKNKVFFEPLTDDELKAISGTRYYLDFETIAFPAPVWPGTRPYQQVPFQWSCHIEKRDGGRSHKMFLDMSGGDPSRKFAESMVRTLGKRGPIIVYNQGFEKRIIRELAERFADLAPTLNSLLDRIVDLLPIAKTHFYHPKMQGSWSIKRVLRAIAPELDYSNLDEVTDGTQAQDAYLEAIDTATHLKRKEALRQSLEEYCRRDTEAMVRIVQYLSA